MLNQQLASMAGTLWMLLVYSILCVPFARLNGVFYAAVLLASIIALRNTAFRPALVVLLVIHAYQLFVTLIVTGSIPEVRELNSGLMVQTSVALATMALFAFGGLNQGVLLPAIIVSTALLGLAAEALGVDMQALLPSKYHESATHVPGAVSYGSIGDRLRGFYAESSAVGAVCGGIAGISVIALVTGRNRYAYMNCALGVMLVMCIASLALTLTKAGVIMVFATLAGGLTGMILLRQTSWLVRTGLVFVCVTCMAALGRGWIPEQIKDYAAGEWDSLAVLFAGGDELAVVGKGNFARSQGYEIGVASLSLHPLGTVQSSVVDVATEADIALTDELLYWFSNGIYGLKSFLPNLAVTGGILCLAAYVVFLALLARTFNGWRNMWTPAVVVQVCAAVAASVVFSLVVEDRYFVYAYSVILFGMGAWSAQSSARA